MNNRTVKRENRTELPKKIANRKKENSGMITGRKIARRVCVAAPRKRVNAALHIPSAGGYVIAAPGRESSLPHHSASLCPAALLNFTSFPLFLFFFSLVSTQSLLSPALPVSCFLPFPLFHQSVTLSPSYLLLSSPIFLFGRPCQQALLSSL